MVTLETAIQRAIGVPAGTPTYESAVSLCIVRGVGPHDFPPPRPYMSVALQNWQLVIVEALLLATVRDASAGRFDSPMAHMGSGIGSPAEKTA